MAQQLLLNGLEADEDALVREAFRVSKSRIRELGTEDEVLQSPLLRRTLLVEMRNSHCRPKRGRCKRKAW